MLQCCRGSCVWVRKVHAVLTGQGGTRQGRPGLEQAGQGWPRQGMAEQGWTRQGNAEQGLASSCDSAEVLQTFLQ